MIETSKLHEYVDGELSDAERLDVESRLAGCKASQAEVASIRGLKSTLAASSNIECSDVWANCKSRLDTIDRVARSGNFITKYSWAFVSAVAMVVVIGGGFARHAQAGSVDSSSLAGVFSSSRSTSPERAFRNDQLDQLLRSADRNLSKIRAISDTKIMINGIPAERFDFEDVHGKMTLLALPQVSSFDGLSPNKEGTYYFGQIESYTNAVAWKTKNLALILVGSRDFASLEKIARDHFIQPE